MCMYVCSCRIIRILLTTSAHGCLDRTSCIMVRRSSSKRPACISTDHTSCDTLHLKQASIDEQSSSTGSPMKTSFIFQENNGLTSCPVVGMNCRRHFWTPSDKPILQRYKKYRYCRHLSEDDTLNCSTQTASGFSTALPPRYQH